MELALRAAGCCCTTPSLFSLLWHFLQGGINFAIFSASATAVSLVLFNEGDLQGGRITHEIPLCPEMNRTGDIWHILLPRLRDDLLYGEQI